MTRLSGSAGHPIPEAFYAIEEGARLRRMPPGAVAHEGRLELLQQLALFVRQVDRRFHEHLAVQVARRAAAHRTHAAIAHAEHLATLRFGGHAQFDLAAQRRNADRVAQRRLRDAHRYFAMQVVAVALEDLVRAHAHFDEQIARRRARRAGFAFALQAHAIAVVHAGGDLHREDFLLLQAALPHARLARVLDDLAAPGAMRARLLHLEDAALHAHLAAAMARRAGLQFTVFRSGAGAMLAGHERGHFHALVDAGHRFFEIQLHHVADVGAAARTATCTTAENVAEDVPEDVAHVGVTGTAATAAHAVVERGVAVLVVRAALGRIGEDLVGLLALLERGFRGVVAGIAGGVVLHRATAIGLLQVVVAGVACHAEGFVVIAFAHGAGVCFKGAGV